MTDGRAGGGMASVMDDNMGTTNNQKQGSLTLARGGLYATRKGRTEGRVQPDWKLDREMADAFAGITGEDGSVPSKGIYAIRDRSQHPWRVLWRRFLEARTANAPLEQALAPIRVLEMRVRELYGEAAKPKSAA